MAGAGSRFASAGYAEPKPLIPMHGVPMIRVVVNNLQPSEPHRFIFICQRSHVKAYGLRDKLAAWADGSTMIEIDGLTEGAVSTVLAAAAMIDNDEPLMIANSDQFVDMNIDDYLTECRKKQYDGMIMTMWADDPKWSFAALGPDALVTRVVEKQVISNEATAGIYNFRHGRDFVAAARRMIRRNERVNNEFYVAPTYNDLIAQGQKIGVHNVGRVDAGMYGLGIPRDLQAFLALPLSHRICAGVA